MGNKQSAQGGASVATSSSIADGPQRADADRKVPSPSKAQVPARDGEGIAKKFLSDELQIY